VVAGRLKVLARKDTGLDSSDIYCQALAAIKNEFASGRVSAAVTTVATIEDTIEGNLVPTSCESTLGLDAVPLEESAVNSTTKNIGSSSLSAGKIFAIVICGAFVAVVALLLYRRRHRNTRDEVDNINLMSSSDLERMRSHNNSTSSDVSEARQPSRYDVDHS
jgi:hypothetical protein